MEAPDFIDHLERDLTAAVAVRQWILLTGALQEGAGVALQGVSVHFKAGLTAASPRTGAESLPISPRLGQ